MNSPPLLNKLNTGQKEAVISEHKRLLVLSGAGSIRQDKNIMNDSLTEILQKQRQKKLKSG